MTLTKPQIVKITARARRLSDSLSQTRKALESGEQPNVSTTIDAQQALDDMLRELGIDVSDSAVSRSTARVYRDLAKLRERHNRRVGGGK